MTLPIVLIGSTFLLYLIFSKCFIKKGYSVKLKQSFYGLTSRIIITTVLFLYPGLCVRVFQVFKCKTLMKSYDGHPSLNVLQQDFRVKCFSKMHLPYLTLAGVALGIYVIAIPLLLLFLLKKSRPYMFLKNEEKTNPQHEAVQKSYGSLYLQYEETYWWWELVVMVKKMILTGAMVVILPGSSFQILAGLFIAIFYMLSVLKIAPFLEDADDWLSFTTSVQLVLTLLMGLILKLNSTDFPEGSVGRFLIGMQLLNFSIFGIAIVLLMPQCRHRLRTRKHRQERELRKHLIEKHYGTTKITPLSENAQAFAGNTMNLDNLSESESESDEDEKLGASVITANLKHPKSVGIIKNILE